MIPELKMDGWKLLGELNQYIHDVKETYPWKEYWDLADELVPQDFARRCREYLDRAFSEQNVFQCVAIEQTTREIMVEEECGTPIQASREMLDAARASWKFLSVRDAVTGHFSTCCICKAEKVDEYAIVFYSGIILIVTDLPESPMDTRYRTVRCDERFWRDNATIRNMKSVLSLVADNLTGDKR